MSSQLQLPPHFCHCARGDYNQTGASTRHIAASARDGHNLKLNSPQLPDGHNLKLNSPQCDRTSARSPFTQRRLLIVNSDNSPLVTLARSLTGAFFQKNQLVKPHMHTTYLDYKPWAVFRRLSPINFICVARFASRGDAEVFLFRIRRLVASGSFELVFEPTTTPTTKSMSTNH